jgi:uncharacterized protein (TIGR03086 family)
MTGQGAATRRTGGVELLERAIAYALGAVHAVTPAMLTCPTPCEAWDLRALLHHVDDSLAALHEGIEGPAVGLGPSPEAEGRGPATDLAQRFRDRAGRLLGALTRADSHDRVIAVGDLPLTDGILAGAGAVEVAVHGWDVAAACGRPRPVPDQLAVELFSLSRLLVEDGGRAGLFGPPVPVSALAGPSDRLVAFLGRDPGR